MLGIIRVLTTDNQDVLQEHGKRMKEYYQISTESRCIPSQPNGIYDDGSEGQAIPKIVTLVEQMAEKVEIDAITISCAADPALEEARKAVNVPVLGAGVSGAHSASMIGNKVGVIGITENPPPQMKRELGKRFHSYSFEPTLRKTTDLFAEEAKGKLLHIVKNAIESGADIILFACTGFSTIRLKDFLVQHIHVPVIDLVEAQGSAYQLIGGNGRNEE